MTSIVSVAAATDAAWDDAWGACRHATYFHSRHWAELWSAGHRQGLRPSPQEVTFSDGKTALLPLSARRRTGTPIRQYVSSPGGTYGGWISDVELTAEHRMLLARHLVHQRGDLTWRLNPFETPDYEAECLGSVAADHTQVLTLTDGFDVISRTFTKGHRSAANKSRREGVHTALASSEADWSAFEQVYRDSVRRWGDRASTVHDSSLFHSLARAPGVRLWVALHEGKVIAGAVCLYAPNHVSYWLGGALESAFPMRPVHLLMHTAIEDACSRGVTWFDFNPSGGHEGVAAFKKGFGTVRLPAPVVVRYGRASRLLNTRRSIRR